MNPTASPISGNSSAAAMFQWFPESDLIAWDNFSAPFRAPSYLPEPKTLEEFIEQVQESDRLPLRQTLNSILERSCGKTFRFTTLERFGHPQTLSARCVSLSCSSVIGVIWDSSTQTPADQRLRNEWRLIDSIVENNPNAIFVKNASDLTFVRFNRANEALLGFSKDDVIGKTDYDLFTKEQADFFTQKDREALSAGGLVEIEEETVLTSNGKTRYLRTKKIPICDEHNHPTHLLGISEDITERKLAEDAHRKSQAQLQAILDNATSVIYLKDHNFRYVTVNRQFERIFHVSRDETVGKTDYDIFSAAIADRFRENDSQVLQHDNPIQVEEETLQNGNLHTYISIKFPVADESGATRFIGGISTDITARKRAEDALRTTRDQLEIRVEQRTTELKQANESLQSEILERTRAEAQLAKQAEELAQSNKELQRSLNELKARNEEIKSFYHTVSHELKTPLMATREFISIVSDGIGGPLTEKQLKYLRIAKDGCEQVQATINDLIDTTRLETGKIRVILRKVSLSEVMETVAATFFQKAHNEGVHLTWECHPDCERVVADKERLIQVFSNLVSNAIKHTHQGGSIEISASIFPRDRNFALATVKDSGEGISSEHLPKIFDRLYQIKRDDLSVSGSLGLGLHICREFTERFGGEIWVESEKGRGSSFYLTLPRHLD